MFPYALLNYIFGTLPIRNKEFLGSYFVASFLWSLPCSYLGVLLDDLTAVGGGGGGGEGEGEVHDTGEEDTLNTLVSVAGIFSTILATAMVSIIVKRRLNEIIAAEEEKRKRAVGDSNNNEIVANDGVVEI